MVPRHLLPAFALLLIATLLAGCGQQAAPQAPETPATTSAPAPTVPDTTPVPPTTTASAEPFPGALSLGTPYRYGREDIAMEVTVYRVKEMDEYEWWSPNWGRYWNTSPKRGNHFLFALVRLIDRGTARARLPSPGMFVLHADGNTYVETTDRDNSLWIKGIDVKQYEYSFEDKAGWIDPAESNKVEGFLLYEVPKSVTPDRAYLEVTFSSKADAVWKLG
jgi:hypothetical protein